MSDQEREAIRQAGAEDTRRSRAEYAFPERIEDPAAVAMLAAILRDTPVRHGATPKSRGWAGLLLPIGEPTKATAPETDPGIR